MIHVNQFVENQLDGEKKPAGQETTLQSHYDDTMLNEILVFIHNNVYASYTVEDLCQELMQQAPCRCTETVSCRGLVCIPLFCFSDRLLP